MLSSSLDFLAALAGLHSTGSIFAMLVQNEKKRWLKEPVDAVTVHTKVTSAFLTRASSAGQFDRCTIHIPRSMVTCKQRLESRADPCLATETLEKPQNTGQGETLLGLTPEAKLTSRNLIRHEVQSDKAQLNFPRCPSSRPSLLQRYSKLWSLRQASSSNTREIKQTYAKLNRIV
ncbi:hypothetical protein RRG08_020132 [Elysia crispata]|uniref:Uncharacterized protein n=1 Tax=Elysia crispata TaxID=231223 RepID=A0AAE1A4L8_9GAST|nr:hypothetical protein RRG08_020132 [Elysia crispata]